MSQPGTPRPASRHFDFEDLAEDDKPAAKDDGAAAEGDAPAAAPASSATKEEATASHMQDCPELQREEPNVQAPLVGGGVEHWNETAEAFVQMLLDIHSRECIGGQGWMEGMRRLIDDVERKGHDPGFDQFAGNLLRDAHIANMSVHPWKVKLIHLKTRLETIVCEATKELDMVHDWTLRPGVWGEASRQKARKEGAIIEPPFSGFCFGQRASLFVGLPLTLYLSDCPHLYTLVRRMRTLMVPDDTQPSAASVRAALDFDGRPYATLTFALLAALQVLNAGRLPRAPGCEGLEGLCATAVSNSGVQGWMSVASDQFVGGGQPLGCLRVSGGGALIFRGIWVPAIVDENLAKYSWAFNSFSRSLEGVLSVLDFYSNPQVDANAAALAQAHSHVLLYVARFQCERWAFPVQLFNSGAAADTEKEVLVPPFVEYVFEHIHEDSFELSSEEPAHVLSQKLALLEMRWAMQFQQEAPLLQKLLKGRGSDLHTSLDRPLRVSVRFISCIRPSEPIARLFGGTRHQSPHELLLTFPAPEKPVCPAGPFFISPDVLGSSLQEAHELLDAIQRGDKKAVNGMQSNMAAACRSINAGMEPKSAPRSWLPLRDP